MTKNLYPTDVVKQAQSVQDAWDQIKADMTFGDLTLGMLTADITQSDPLEAQITNLETQLTNLRNERDDLYLSMWEKVKRVRAGVKGNFGDDSSQYEMVGGTRLSERKSPVRKAAATKTA
jgi:hypothetical protein